MASVTLTIDGCAVEAQEGMTVLEAARQAGIYIPTLCHHEDLEPFGGCRMCLVEINGLRGLLTACTTKVAPGMEVRTDSPQIERVRRITLELLLADHPLECLLCASNQRCELQQVAAYLGIKEIRYPRSRDELPLDTSNPLFLHDSNKCILCGRCVRTCHELQGLGAIDFVYRGGAADVQPPAGLAMKQSACESCGECVVRCPSGALANLERRSPLRLVKTICTYCGTGCSLYLGVRGGEIVSSEGDRDSPVNRGKLCVKGRYGNSFVNSPDRLTTPLIKRNGIFEKATWDEALDLVASKFSQYRGDQFAAIGSSRCTNEENYLVMKLARAVMGTNNVDNCARLCHAPTVTGLTTAFGTGGGTNPLADIAGAGCIFVIGSNTTSAHPVAGVQVRSAAARGAKLIVADPRAIELARHADIYLAQRPGTDVPLLMGMAKVIVDEGLHDREFIESRAEDFDEFVKSLQRFDLDTVEAISGVPRDQIVKAAMLYATAGPALIIYSLGITEHTHGTDNVLAVANLAMLTGNVGKPSAGVMPMRGQNNVQGACDMGCIPGAYHGYQGVAKPEVREKFERAWGVPLPDKPGFYLTEMIPKIAEGQVKAMYVVGMDVAYSISDANQVMDALRKAEFLVFQDIFLTGSAEFADVILPATSFAEKDGTFTNLERRVQRVRKAIEPLEGVRPDWWITREIARRMGAKGFDFADPSEILDELASLSPSFAGISFARLDEGGIQWPCPGPDHPGTPRLHVEKFNTPTGKGHFSPLEYRPPAESADEDYPFILTTGRSLYHFHLAMTCRVPGLMDMHPEEEVWMNPDDAARLDIRDGDRVKVSSRRGELAVKAKVTRDMHPGTAFMTFHFYETPTNVLTMHALDPAAKTPEFKVTAIRIEKAASGAGAAALEETAGVPA